MKAFSTPYARIIKCQEGLSEGQHAEERGFVKN